MLNSDLQKTAQGSMTEKVKNRLEQLDDFEEVSTLEIISGLLADLKYLLKQPDRNLNDIHILGSMAFL